MKQKCSRVLYILQYSVDYSTCSAVPQVVPVKSKYYSYNATNLINGIWCLYFTINFDEPCPLLGLLAPPPAYDSIFVSEQNSRQSKPNVHHDDRNLWEKVHEWFEFSILQQIIWLGAFVFAITYISFGLKYAGQCFRKKYDGNGKTIEEDLPSFMKAEGGVLCALVLYVFCWRLIFICDRKRTHRINKADLEGRKKCGGYLFFFCCGLCFATFVLCILGATKVFQFHDVTKNHTLKCNDEFYNFYHDTKIGQMAILIPYAVYVIVSMFIVIPKAKNWFMRHKWHQWASLLDADQDGIISSDDMKKTNATLEQLRLAVGDRRTALNADAQKNGGMIIFLKEELTNTSLLKTMSLIWREFIIHVIWGTKCAQLSPAFLISSLLQTSGRRIAFWRKKILSSFGQF
ncbi:unnamed protein product [Mytilus edulis]|uniref:EF-hand domain-containing protein n=1 Tax=Mytilus edulis TaxID=6550 RepID=A0A8S3T3R5_MYTED|nr:unnamed protein product [Mytilus edulis]